MGSLELYHRDRTRLIATTQLPHGSNARYQLSSVHMKSGNLVAVNGGSMGGIELAPGVIQI
jgi:hypothetical protein